MKATIKKECGHKQIVEVPEGFVEALRSNTLTLGDRLNRIAPYRAGKCDECKTKEADRERSL